jgi:hypothetical protein
MTSLNTVAAQLPLSMYVQAAGVLAGCKVHTYVAGTTTPQATYQDYAGAVANSNPITLDTNGAATIRWLANTGYKIVINDPTDVTTLASEDNVYFPQTGGGGAFYGGADTGSANTYTVTLPGTLLTGTRVWFIPAHNNTGASTLNGTTILNFDGGSLFGAELQATVPIDLIYNGTYWQISAPPSASNTFTCTITGCTTSPTGTGYFQRVGNMVTVTLPTITATSNATGLTYTFTQPTALPVPQRAQNVSINFLEDNTAATAGSVQVSSSGVFTFFKGANTSAAAWTNSGTKGLAAACTFTYMLS